MRRSFAITPFLIITIIVIVKLIYDILRYDHLQDEFGLDGMGIACLLVIAVFVGIMDLLMKILIKPYKNVAIFQVVLISVIAIFQLLSNVKQTIMLPEDFNKTYVSIIYEIEGEKSLPHRLNPLQQPIYVNSEGYVFTSSTPKNYPYRYGLHKYTLATSDKVEVGSDASPYKYSTFHMNHVNYSGKTYPYLTFKIGPKDNCCYINVTDIDERHYEVQQYLKSYFN